MSAQPRLIIDVREPEEFALDHVDGALNIPLGQLQSDPQLQSLNPDTEIILYCRSGARAGTALQILHRLGFTNAQNGINANHVHQLITKDSGQQ